MIIGILSDTHGKVPATRAAVAALRAAGVGYFIHCGDVGDVDVLDEFAGLSMSFVWGNTDDFRAVLRGHAQLLGLHCHEEFADLELAGKKIAVAHGDKHQIVLGIMNEARHDYFLHGHTHLARDEKPGAMRIINPGALHRTSHPSVAVLDTERDAVRFIPIEVER